MIHKERSVVQESQAYKPFHPYFEYCSYYVSSKSHDSYFMIRLDMTGQPTLPTSRLC